MAKRKNKNLPKHKSPLELAANDSVSHQARLRHEYRMAKFAERDRQGGVGLNGMRLERLACVKALEGLARSHPKRKSPFLEPYHLMAANAYHADLLAIEGRSSHAFKERIDTMHKTESGLTHRLDVLQKIGKVDRELGEDAHLILKRILVDRPDDTLAQIWPNRTDQNKARDLIKSGLCQLAVIYGLAGR